jgi:hypothetical protein
MDAPADAEGLPAELLAPADEPKVELPVAA